MFFLELQFSLSNNINSLAFLPMLHYLFYAWSCSSPVNLLGRDLLCKLNCSIYCTPRGIEFHTNVEDVVFKIARQKSDVGMYPLLTSEDLPIELQDTVLPNVWDFTGKISDQSKVLNQSVSQLNQMQTFQESHNTI